MKGLIKQLKYRFYRQSITKRIILVITMLSILSNAVFVGSVFVIMKNQMFNKTKLDHEKDITMLEKELEMFFNGIRNDAVSVLVSDSCQTLLSDSEEFLSSDTAIQYRKYKLMQGTIMSTIGQRPEYNTIAFYDLNGNCYADERLIESRGYLGQQQERVRDFLDSDKNEAVTFIHKSPWRKKKETDFKDCISYLRKVYNKNKGQLIGVVELDGKRKQYLSCKRGLRPVRRRTSHALQEPDPGKLVCQSGSGTARGWNADIKDQEEHLLPEAVCGIWLEDS